MNVISFDFDSVPLETGMKTTKYLSWNMSEFQSELDYVRKHNKHVENN